MIETKRVSFQSLRAIHATVTVLAKSFIASLLGFPETLFLRDPRHPTKARQPLENGAQPKGCIG